MNELTEFIRRMPKVELHVHLEGAIQPETLLILAKRHGIALPAEDVAGLREWYTFRDFDSFIRIYLAISECIRTVDDIETITLEFLKGQAEQNIVYSEVTYTAHTHFATKGLAFDDQLAAINRARATAARAWNVHMNLVIDIPRLIPASEGLRVADWVIDAHGNGVVAMGLGGPEKDHPASKYAEAFAKIHAAGVPSVPHAGETDGPSSIWSALKDCHAARIGHGVQCLADAALVETLRERKIPLEVCPTSNICLKLFPDLASHPLPQLMDEGLIVTINSDDPPMFNTTLTDEFLTCAATFGFERKQLESFVITAAEATLLDDQAKQQLVTRCQDGFAAL